MFCSSFWFMSYKTISFLFSFYMDAFTPYMRQKLGGMVQAKRNYPIHRSIIKYTISITYYNYMYKLKHCVYKWWKCRSNEKAKVCAIKKEIVIVTQLRSKTSPYFLWNFVFMVAFLFSFGRSVALCKLSFTYFVSCEFRWLPT